MDKKRTFLQILLIFALFLALSQRYGLAQSEKKTEKSHLLCTTYPIYLLALNILNGCDEDIELSLLVPPSSGCPHDYFITPGDIKRMAKAKFLLANGMDLDEPIIKMAQKTNPNLKIYIGAGYLKGHISDEEKDPHIFTNPRYMALMGQGLAQDLILLDKKNKEKYLENAIVFREKMDDLLTRFKALTEKMPTKLIITEHHAFGHLAREIGLEIMMVIQDIPGQNPSASDIFSKVNAIKKQRPLGIFTEPQYSGSTARILADETGIFLGNLDPCATGPDKPNPNYFVEVMNKNILVLEESTRHYVKNDGK